jgi:DNA repair protein RadC
MSNINLNDQAETYTNQPVLEEAEDSKYVLSEQVSKKQMYQLMLSLLEQEYFRVDQLTSPTKTIKYLQVKLAKYTQEVFCCIYLDSNQHVIGFEELFVGTLDSCFAYQRQAVKQCMLNNAAAVLFAHNHPSGDPSPSNADEVLTKRLKEALALVDIRVLDYIVIGGSTSTLFAERGLI